MAAWNRKDLMGQRFGRLVVIAPAENTKAGKARWLCQCDCGNQKVITSGNLLSGDTRSCGCLHIDELHAKAQNLVGKKIGRLTVLSQEYKGKSIQCFCRCDCGKEKWIPYRGLHEETTQSCGCLSADVNREKATKHGFCGEDLYNVHRTLKQRCLNPNSHDYKWYGAKGITVCEEWLDYPAFRVWALNNGYRKGLTIERLNVYGNYCPENCTWIPLKDQMKNKTNSLCNRGLEP